jgi:hypothetical protein
MTNMTTRFVTTFMIAAFICGPAAAAPLAVPGVKAAPGDGTLVETVRGHGGGHGHASFGGGRMAFSSHGSGARFFSGHHRHGRAFVGYSSYGYYGYDSCWWSRRYHRWVCPYY